MGWLGRLLRPGRVKVQPLGRRQSLEGIPVLNEGVTVNGREPDRLVLTVRVRRGTGFLSRFQPPVMERTLKLDELGSFVFRQVDGRNTARSIVDEFVRRYRTNRREAELSTVAFLKSLAARGVISIVIR